MPEPRFVDIKIYSRKVVHHPGRNISHKHMVKRSVGKVRLQRPCFGQSCISFCLYPISPRRSFRFGCHFHNIFNVAVACKHCGNGFTAYQAEIEEIIVCRNNFVQPCRNILFPSFGHKPEVKCERLRGLRSFGVCCRFGIEKLGVYAAFQFCGLAFERCSVLAQQRGKACH